MRVAHMRCLLVAHLWKWNFRGKSMGCFLKLTGEGRKKAIGADDRKDRDDRRDDDSRDGWRYERMDGKEKTTVMEDSSRSDEERTDED